MGKAGTMVRANQVSARRGHPRWPIPGFRARRWNERNLGRESSTRPHQLSFFERMLSPGPVLISFDGRYSSRNISTNIICGERGLTSMHVCFIKPGHGLPCMQLPSASHREELVELGRIDNIQSRAFTVTLFRRRGQRGAGHHYVILSMSGLLWDSLAPQWQLIQQRSTCNDRVERHFLRPFSSWRQGAPLAFDQVPRWEESMT